MIFNDMLYSLNLNELIYTMKFSESIYNEFPPQRIT
jgi:hypothetical protein